MRTFDGNLGKSGTWRRFTVTALAIAAFVVVASGAQTMRAAATPDRPVSKCSDFGCEQ